MNNLLDFSDFIANWKAQQQKKTKRTDVGLDVIKENIYNGKSEKRTVLPDLYVVKKDITDYWVEDIREKAGKIYSIYLVDKSEETHLASLQADYYLYWLYNQVENDENFDEDELSVIEYFNGNIDPNEYVPVNTNFIEEIKVDWDDTELEEAMKSEDEYNELIEKVIDYLKGNHII
jgi:hypothetical protein